jgi:hypothetical protein
MRTVPHIRFKFEVECENPSPARVVLPLEGEIVEYLGQSQNPINIGGVSRFLIQWDRALNEGVSLSKAMDAVSKATLECFEALFDPETEEWSAAVIEVYSHDIVDTNVLFIESIELAAEFRAKGIGHQVAIELIRGLGAGCGLVAVNPRPSQYSDPGDPQHALSQDSSYRAGRMEDFAKIEAFWMKLGFRQLPGTAFFTYAPQLEHQPARNSGRVDRRIQ